MGDYWSITVVLMCLWADLIKKNSTGLAQMFMNYMKARKKNSAKKNPWNTFLLS